MFLLGILIVSGLIETMPTVAVRPDCRESRSITNLAKNTVSFSIDSSVPVRFHPKIEAAVVKWADHLNLNAVRCVDCEDTNSLRFRFVIGDHGDRFPFRQDIGKVAHVVSIKSEERLPEIHFHAGAFIAGSDEADIYFVALHEIGHAFGLSHSGDLRSIMYPIYQRGGEILDQELRSSPIVELRLANLSTLVNEMGNLPPLCEGVGGK